MVKKTYKVISEKNFFRNNWAVAGVEELTKKSRWISFDSNKKELKLPETTKENTINKSTNRGTR